MYIWMLTPALVLLGLIIYFPVSQGIITAFRRYTMLDLSQTRFNGIDNFVAIFTNPNIKFAQIMLNTALWVAVSLVGQFVLGFILALLLRKPFRGRGIYTG
ncbi:MAG: sugar ABC transporter permease, partial [Treponema sp.]|nr:sugar ABC transporter permease [Treponema sp.]